MKTDFYDSLRFVTIWVMAFILILGFLIFVYEIANASDTIQITCSWYSVASLKKEGSWAKWKGVMANGQQFDENALTCACRCFPLGSSLLVRNLANGKSVVVRVTDKIGKRFATTRIDLSKRAFSEIADLKQGLVSCEVKRIK